MAFKVIVLASAREDIVEATDHILLDSRDQAERWYRGVWKAIFSLSDAPEAFAMTPESEELGQELRAVHYHSHRIVFRVRREDRIVEVLRVYHGARRSLKGTDLD